MFFMMGVAMQSLFDIARGGHANMFIGDGLLAASGAPKFHPDRACV